MAFYYPVNNTIIQKSSKIQKKVLVDENKKLKTKINKPVIKEMLKIMERNNYLQNENRKLNNQSIEERLLDIDKSMDNFLICQICMNRYSEQRLRCVLYCGHVYCKQCVLDWSEKNIDLTCAFCKKKNQMPEFYSNNKEEEEKCLDYVTKIMGKAKSIISRIKKGIQKSRRKKPIIEIDRFYEDIEDQEDYVKCKLCIPSRNKFTRKGIENHFFTKHRKEFFKVVYKD